MPNVEYRLLAFSSLQLSDVLCFPVPTAHDIAISTSQTNLILAMPASAGSYLSTHTRSLIPRNLSLRLSSSSSSRSNHRFVKPLSPSQSLSLTSSSPFMVPSTRSYSTASTETQGYKFKSVASSQLKVWSDDSVFDLPQPFLLSLSSKLYSHTMLRVKDPEKSLHFYCEVSSLDSIPSFVLFERPRKKNLFFRTFTSTSISKHLQVLH